MLYSNYSAISHLKNVGIEEIMNIHKTQSTLTHEYRELLPIVDIDRQPTISSDTQCFPIIAHVIMHANSFYRHTATPYYRSRHHEALHRPATNYFSVFHNVPYYRSSEHAIKLLLSSHNVSLLSTSTGNQLFSAQQNVSLLSLRPYYRSGERAHKPI